jgi:hypothetical protein
MSIALKLLAQIFRTTKTWAYSLSYIAQVILPVLKRVQTLPRFAACSAQNASKRSVYRSAALAAGSYCASVESVNASRSEPPREFSARICRRWSRALSGYSEAQTIPFRDSVLGYTFTRLSTDRRSAAHLSRRRQSSLEHYPHEIATPCGLRNEGTKPAGRSRGHPPL